MLALLAYATPGSPGSAKAATATANIAVTLTMPAFCTFSTTNMAFGSYTGAVVYATGTLTVTCANTVAYNITGDAGQHWTKSGGSYDASMAGPSGALLHYTYYQDSAHTKVWGLTSGTDSEAGTGTGSPQTYTAYGVLAGGSHVQPGAYIDTLTFYVNY